MNRRGMSLLELMLALSITSMVGVAISGMMNAMTTGVVSKRDARSTLIRSHAAQARLSAYITPSRSILGFDPDSIVLWIDDARGGQTVHLSEVRWIQYDAVGGTIVARSVQFPDDWSDMEKEIADEVFPRDSDWEAVMMAYDVKGYIATMILVDGLGSASVATDSANALAARHAHFDLGFTTDAGTRLLMATATIQHHQPPVS